MDVAFMNVAHREVNGVPVVVKANIIICRRMSGWRIGFGVNLKHITSKSATYLMQNQRKV